MKTLISRLFLHHHPQHFCPSLTFCPAAAIVNVNTAVPSCSYRKKSYVRSSSSTEAEGKHPQRSSALWSWQTRISSVQKKTAAQSSPFNGNDNNKKSSLLLLRRLVLTDNDDDPTKSTNEIACRVRSPREEKMVQEWVQVLAEIELINQFKQGFAEERLEAAKQKVLCEMEKLKTAESLDGLDLAIESALSSEVN